MMKEKRNAIVVQNLKKSYSGTPVLRDVTFSVKEGNIFALLGSNGAGKTTIIKILTTLTHFNAGDVRIFDYDVLKKSHKARSCIALTGQSVTVDQLLSGRENLEMIASLRNLSNSNIEAERLLDFFHLTESADRLVSTYSGGMIRRLDIAMSMMGDSPILFLDEPTTGLDPQSRLAMWNMMREIAANGKTIVLTTQYLDEAEQLADDIAILHDGTVIAKGTVEELKRKLPQGIMKLKLKNKVDKADVVELLSHDHIHNHPSEYELEVQTDGSSEQFARILTQINQAGIELVNFSSKQPTLEDAFLTLIEEMEGTKNGA
jgi:ABC-2 type transport system ATP-binding protein